MRFDLAALGTGLPASAVLPALAAALGEPPRRAVVEAPPGSGKTTLVPPAVAEALARDGRTGRVIVTQPRRVAARAAAARLAALTGTALGAVIGYSVRGDSRTSRDTRIEFVTPGLLLRRLLGDAELRGVDAVVLDEVHERDLDSDLVFALLHDVAELRALDGAPLTLVAMSATLDAERWARLLGDGTPALSAAATPHPLAIEYAPLPQGAARLDVRGVTPALLDHVAATAAGALTTGAALVFLPGAREVDAVVARLRAAGVTALPLHGGLSAREQDAALSPSGQRRAIVSTSIAESSLTVPEVQLVVDACLAREPRQDLDRGVSGLVTVSVSHAAGDQRAGRAARLGPGRAIRCVSEAEWAAFPAEPKPEIATADLTSAALSLAAWGDPDAQSLTLPEAPPVAALARAQGTLIDLGALAPDDHRITPRGRVLARIPAHPRAARALIDGAAQVGTGAAGVRRAAESVAVLESTARAPGADLDALRRALGDGRSPEAKRWREDARRLERLAGANSGGNGPGSDSGNGNGSGNGSAVRDSRGTTGATGTDTSETGRHHGRAGDSGDATELPAAALAVIAALAYPDRLARLRSGGSASGPRTGTAYLLANGTGATLPPHSPLAGSPWLAISDLGLREQRAGSVAVIRAAVPVDEATALEIGASLLREEVDAVWDGHRVSARRTRRLGAIALSTTPIRPDAETAREAVRATLEREGIGALPWTESATRLRHRLALLHRELGDPWPEMTDAALASRADDWLDLDSLAAGRRPDLAGSLRALVPWPQAGRIDELAPERLAVPSGSQIRVDYPEHGDPVLAVKLQETFGWEATPTVAGGRVPVLLHLLSPARRPLAITGDLASFWTNAYPQVRAEMRGRYPKHPWPEDPRTAPARRGTTASGH